MAVLDIIILVVLGLCVLMGAIHGLIRQLGSIVGLFLGIWLACRFSSPLAGYMSSWIHASEQIVKVIAFTLILIFTVLGMSLLGRMLEKVFTSAALGWLNRIAGVLFSLLAGIMFLGVIFLLLKYVDQNWFSFMDDKVWSESRLAGTVMEVCEKIFPYLKKMTLPDF